MHYKDYLQLASYDPDQTKASNRLQQYLKSDTIIAGYGENPQNLSNGCRSYREAKHFHNKLKHKTLVLYNHDSNVVSGSSVYEELVNLSYVKIMTPHCVVSDDTFISVPLGTRYLINNKIGRNKDRLITAGFSIDTTPDGYRRGVYEDIKHKEDWVDFYEFGKFSKNPDYSAYYQNLSQYQFCIAPRGFGFDTYRYWECFALGVIPVVEWNPWVEQWDGLLPFLIVDSYKDLNPSDLPDYDDFYNKAWRWEYCDISYWKQFVYNSNYNTSISKHLEGKASIKFQNLVNDNITTRGDSNNDDVSNNAVTATEELKNNNLLPVVKRDFWKKISNYFNTFFSNVKNKILWRQ